MKTQEFIKVTQGKPYAIHHGFICFIYVII